MERKFNKYKIKYLILKNFFMINKNHRNKKNKINHK